MSKKRIADYKAGDGMSISKVSSYASDLGALARGLVMDAISC